MDINSINEFLPTKNHARKKPMLARLVGKTLAKPRGYIQLYVPSLNLYSTIVVTHFEE